MKNLYKSCVILTLAGVVSMPVLALDVVNPDVKALLPLPVSDMKTYNGNQCEAYEVWDADVVQNQTSEQGSAIVGAGTHISASLPTPIVCPIVRDNTTNTNGTLGVDVYIGNVAGQEYQCTLNSLTPHGKTVGSDVKSTVEDGNQTLVLDVKNSMNGDVNSSVNGGSYTLFCMLPRDAYLFSYRVREFSNQGVGTANTDNNN